MLRPHNTMRDSTQISIGPNIIVSMNEAPFFVVNFRNRFYEGEEWEGNL